MTKIARFAHRFVEQIPERLEDGVLYISIQYATGVHLCACGCRHEVVTPLSPTDWEMTFDGETVSLAPSIGNWSLKCQSHYWIRRGRVRWARWMSRDEIDRGRMRDRRRKRLYASLREDERSST
jgi:hypothetical protein